MNKKNTQNPILHAENLHKSFGKTKVLQGISLSVFPGESLAIMGPSGEGKTTLLHILAGLDTSDEGSVWILGQSVVANSLVIRRHRIGFIFQSYQLLEDFSLLDNILMPFFITKKGSYEEALARAEALLAFVGLLEKKEEKASCLSGGEKQRAAIARAFMNDPNIIFADEPTGNLDTTNSLAIHRLLLDAVAFYQKGLIIATHDPTLANLCTQKRLLHDGYLR